MSYADALKLSHKQPVLVMVTAQWCGPCKGMKPLVVALSETMNFPLVQLDADENKDLLQVLRIRAVPTLLILSKGSVVLQEGGAKTQAAVKNLVIQYNVASA